MKRRFIMWMTIVCILVVGGTVTKTTRDFVTSQSLKTMEMQAPETVAEKAAGVVEKTESEIAFVAEAVAEETAQVNAVEEHMAVGSNAGAVITDESIPSSEAPEVFSMGAPKAPIDTTKDEYIQETVKSPLDPVVIKETMIEAAEEIVTYYAVDFFERFAQTEQNALRLWENVTAENRSAYLAAAEQERMLWDYELNYVYQVIQSKLSTEEAEALKVLEVEWIKERDLYAEKTAAKSNMKNAQNQNPDYTRALAEKTKERCYWLVSEYEEVLN